MKKSEKYTLNLKDEYNDVSFIEYALLSDKPLRCMYAICSCVINNFKTSRIVEILKKLKNSDLIEWNSCKISNCALAALHLLNIEPYTGSDEQVEDLIDIFANINRPE